MKIKWEISLKRAIEIGTFECGPTDFWLVHLAVLLRERVQYLMERQSCFQCIMQRVLILNILNTKLNQNCVSALQIKLTR